MKVRLLLVASLSAAAAACVFGPSDEQGSGSVAAAISTCVGGARPSSGYGLVSAFGTQRFSQPVAMVPVPNDNDQFYVVEQAGTIRRASTAGTSTLFAD